MNIKKGLLLILLLKNIKLHSQSIDSSRYPNLIYGNEQNYFVYFFNNFKKIIIKNDSLQISNQIFYPLHAAYGTVSITVNNKKDFLKLYNKLLDDRMRKFILSQTIDSVTSTSKGFFIGHGKVWIDQRLNSSGKLITKITTINNSVDMWRK